MEVKEALKQIGLTQNEINVYLVMLRLGSSKAGKISKEAQINRTSTYDALRKLINKGLVSYVYISKNKFFQAVNPRRLHELLKEQEEDVLSIMPRLEEMFSRIEQKQYVTMYKGIKGIKSVLEDILRTCKAYDTYYVFGSEGQLSERMPYYLIQFIKKKQTKKIHTKSLIRKERKRIRKSKDKLTEVRYIQQGIESPVVTNIYKNKIAIILWADVPEAIIIENKAAAETYKSYFNLLWNAAEKT